MKKLLKETYTHLARAQIIYRNQDTIRHWHQVAAKMPEAAIETKLKQSARFRGRRSDTGCQVALRMLKHADWKRIAKEIKV